MPKSEGRIGGRERKDIGRQERHTQRSSEENRVSEKGYQVGREVMVMRKEAMQTHPGWELRLEEGFVLDPKPTGDSRGTLNGNDHGHFAPARYQEAHESVIARQSFRQSLRGHFKCPTTSRIRVRGFESRLRSPFQLPANASLEVMAEGPSAWLCRHLES